MRKVTRMSRANKGLCTLLLADGAVIRAGGF